MITARQSLSTLVFAMIAASSQVAIANPNLVQGVWQDITPPGITKGAPETCIGQGMVLDPKNRSTLYWCTTPYTESEGGLFKSTDAGSTWTKVGKVAPAYNGATDHLSMPVHVRLDPNDSNHLYAGDGVRGSSIGFFVSHDAAATFVIPKGFVDALAAAGIKTQDIYDVAPDPTDFKHALVSFHSAWDYQSVKYGTDAGVIETKDGGDTWIVHPPKVGWGAGHAIKFLYNPAQGIGNSQTWLLGTQGNGFWRTTDSGANWTKVSDNNIAHGGATIYYTRAGVLYASGNTMRSMDNGATWAQVTTNIGSTWCVYGDGTTLYTAQSGDGSQQFLVSPETDGVVWKPLNAQKFFNGAYEMTYDAVNGIMYSSNWSSGAWALKVGPGDPDAGVSGSGGSGGSQGSGGSSGNGGSSGAPGTGGNTASGGGNNGSAGAARVDAGATGGPQGTGTAGAQQGSGGTSASTSTGQVGTDTNAATTDDATPSTDAGCSCRVTKTSNTPPAAALLGLALGLAFARRRRSA